MNLRRLFNMQRGLDTEIVVEKRLDPSKLFLSKVVGLIVELGEATNEWRAFKYWSYNQIPSRDELLEELVDCLHLTLSLGLEMQYEKKAIQFISVKINDFEVDIKRSILTTFQHILTFENIRSSANYLYMFQSLVDLIHELGFTWDEVEEAYEKKNKVNHLRQVEGY
jgi:dimeric dUTPase (all-alpha-NTP-PPase superfamily)